MSEYQRHVFDRSGLAALSDFQAQDWRQLFELLEKDQATFLNKEDQTFSKEYKWPHDPLFNWSRVWEYPYVFYHLKKWRKGFDKTYLPKAVDFGSGVTFFPFSIARLGYHVICVDCDKVCEGDLKKAIKFSPGNQGIVDFRLTDGITLPLEDCEADVVYSISVLEHIASFEKTIDEISRIIKPDGFLILTIDLDLRGDSEISIENYTKLTNKLSRYFNYLYPEKIIHPADILDSEKGPYPFNKKLKSWRLIWWQVKRELRQVISKETSIKHYSPFYLAIQGFVMKKKQISVG